MYRGTTFLFVMFIALKHFCRGPTKWRCVGKSPSMSVLDQTQAKISSNKVMVFSKSYCPSV